MPEPSPPSEEPDPPRGEWHPPWSWAGASIFVLSVCLGGGWATALIMAASSRTPPISGETGDLLNSVGGVLAGAITAYIGGYIARMRQRPPDEKPDANG